MKNEKKTAQQQKRAGGFSEKVWEWNVFFLFFLSRLKKKKTKDGSPRST